jgi:hypothetical protein
VGRLRRFDTTLLGSLEAYFDLLTEKWQSSWDASLFAAAELLDQEWEFLVDAAPEVPGFAATCAKAFWYTR